MSDTVAALATPPGRGGVGVIRVSGPLARNIAKSILGTLPQPRYATLSNFVGENNVVLDQGIALFFAAPHSFTGEDVLELHGHGGAVVMDCILQRIISLGARLANPGEFSERAFLNDKIDLVQAESIADLIDATSVHAAHNAVRSLQGIFSQLVDELKNAITKLRVEVEATIDFTEEEIEFISESKISHNLSIILQQIEKIISSTQQGVIYREGIIVAIAGKPNVGKSSLLNSLSGEETAIVTAIPGTTRDVIRSNIQIDGIPIHLLDTAGLRESEDIVEQEGVRRARAAIEKAQHVLLMIDATQEKSINPHDVWQEYFIQLPDVKKFTIIFNKIDLCDETARSININGIDCIFLSAKTGQGLELLKQHIKTSIGFSQTVEGGFSARRRHLTALKKVQQCLLSAKQLISENSALELIAEELRTAQQNLAEITGEFSSEDLLGQIFSEFCVGK